MIVNTNTNAAKEPIDVVSERNPQRTTRRPWTQWSVVGIVTALVLAFAVNAGRILVVDAPQKSDVILILAGETDRRLERGLQLMDQGYGRTLLIDVPVGARIYGLTEVELAQQYVEKLHRRGVRICAIQGLSTKAESHDAEKCLDQEEGSRVLIVTSDFHTRRARSIFQHEIRNKAFSVAAAFDDTQFGRSWWRQRQWAKTCVDEWLRMIWWVVVDRWH